MEIVFKKCNYDNEDHSLWYDGVDCSLCNSKNCRDDDSLYFNTNDKLSSENSVTAPCCYSLICPNCIEVGSGDEETRAVHLFIKKVVYVGADYSNEDTEEDDVEVYDALKLKAFTTFSDDIQYKWAIYKPFDESLLSQYEPNKVDHNYDSYGIKSMKKTSDGDIWRDLCVQCECKKCKFECSACIYMDS